MSAFIPSSSSSSDDEGQDPLLGKHIGSPVGGGGGGAGLGLGGSGNKHMKSPSSFGNNHHHHSEEEEDPEFQINRTRPQVHGWQALFRCSKTLLIFVGIILTGLTSGTPNAINPIASQLAFAQGLSGDQFNVLVSFALVGMFFTVPAGASNDYLGPFRTCILGMAMSAFGYLGLSFLDHDTYPLMVIAITLCGFGGGFTVTACLATAIKLMRLNPGIGVFLPAASMSFSMALANAATTLYENQSDCTTDTCWRGSVRVLACLIVFFQLPSAFFAFRLYEISPEFVDWQEPTSAYSIEERNNHHRSGTHSNFSDDDDLVPSSLIYQHNLPDQHHVDTVIHEKLPFLKAAAIIKSPFAWVVGLCYTFGVGGGLVVISQIQGLIVSYGGNNSMVSPAVISFSCANAFVGGGLSGFFGDFLTTKFPKLMSRSRVFGVIMFINSLLFYLLGILSSEPAPHSNGALIFYITCLVLVGVGFGANFVFGPSCLGDTYGGTNFGVFFGWTQLLTAAATLSVPSLVGTNLAQAGNAAVSFFTFQYLLSIGAIALFFVKPTPLKI